MPNLNYFNLKTLIHILVLTLVISGAIKVKAGTAVTFDGSTNYISIGSQNFGLTNSLTVMAWVKWEINPTTGNSWANIFTINSTTTKDYGQFWLQHNQTNTKFEFALQTTNGRKYIQSNTQPLAGEWYHVAGVYNGSTISLYINGGLEAQANHSGNIKSYETAFQTMIGQWAYSSEVYRRFAGSLDDVTIYNKALTNAEIIERMDDADIINNPDPGLVGAWKFDEEDGETIIDYSGYDYDGIIINDVTRIIGDAPNNADGSGNLPIEVVGISANIVGAQVVFSWQTLAERNNEKFIISRSYDAKNWDIINELDGAGNSNTLKQYSIIDANPGQGIVFYKLAQIDYNGIKTTFKPVSVEMVGMVELNVYPVPANANSPIIIKSGDEKYSLTILNQAGQVIDKMEVTSFQETISIAKPGVYFVDVNGQGGNSIKKIVIN